VTLDKSGITTDMTEVHSVMVNFINNALAISTTTKSGDVWVSVDLAQLMLCYNNVITG